MSEAEYLEILDWLARDKVAGKRGSTPRAAPPVLERLGIEPTPTPIAIEDVVLGTRNIHVFLRVLLGQSTESACTTAESIRFHAEMLQGIDPKIAKRRWILWVESKVLSMSELCT